MSFLEKSLYRNDESTFAALFRFNGGTVRWGR